MESVLVGDIYVRIAFLYFGNKHIDIEVEKKFQYKGGKRYMVPRINLAWQAQGLFIGKSEILFKDILSWEGNIINYQFFQN